ncbi:MAG: histidinol-phosphate transaminase [Gammaproteobacteria bacterium]|nr:histidinol-phosphate transaminase [Gammaproteobacteria bacterium]MDH3375022.1 histidinol-phosphate transaminase [Gammaproteobacteria bacterium]MDH3554013.1 histidinol-phosphate transaminase [Gammaproteobacteria bacterium]
MTIARLAREEIQALKPYEAAVQVDDTIRLNANEAPWTSSGDHFRRPLNRYPEIRPAQLRAALAGRYGCDAGNLLVTRGTSEAIDLLIRVFCRAGRDSIVTTRPTFSMYRHYANVQGALLREVATSRENDFAVAAGEILDACDDTTRLIFLCSPNNPTGTTLPRTTLQEVLEERRNQSAVVVDEAYIEFADEPSVVELLDRNDNLIVLRTLSKALAFAGARCGSVIGPREVIDMLDAVQAPYALATPVVECVENALQAESLSEADSWVTQVISERERLIAALAESTFVKHIWPSSANFFLMQVKDAELLMQRSSTDKVLLRYFGGVLSDCVRITVGTPNENDRLLETIARVAEV